MLSIEKTAIFLLIVTFASVMTVEAACVERQESVNSTSDSAVDKVSNFFMEVGCTIKSGAEKVKERVESGYNYLKSKITPEDLKNQTLIENSTPPVQAALNNGRITFKDDQHLDNGSEISPTETTTSGNKRPGDMAGSEVDTRISLVAPESQILCSKGQVRVGDKCQQEIDL